MTEFDRLISEQLRTMERLLFVQSEIDKYQEMKSQLCALQGIDNDVEQEIEQYKIELEEIQERFNKQTEEVIFHFQVDQVVKQYSVK